MPLETILEYDEPLVRRAVFLFWRRTIGAFFIPVLLAGTAYFVALLILHDRSWEMGVVGTVLGFAYLMSATVYVVHYRGSLAKFRQLRDPVATFRADHHSITVESSIGKSTFYWACVKEVWQFPDVWLLLFSKAQFSTLPVANLSPELQALIVTRVQSAGGKIS